MKRNLQIAKIIQNGIRALFDLSNKKSTRNCNDSRITLGSHQYMKSSTAEHFENLITRCFSAKSCPGEFSRIRPRPWIRLMRSFARHIYIYIHLKRISLTLFRAKLPPHQSKTSGEEGEVNTSEGWF